MIPARDKFEIIGDFKDWVISISNDNLDQNSLTPPVGSQIRIPSNPNPVIAEYEAINS